MYMNERLNEIMKELNETNYATVEYLAEKLHISSSSVRRDLAALEKRGLVLRSYGGVELADSVNRNIPFTMRKHAYISQKKRIAQVAAKLVKEGDVVFADGSSTCFFLFAELIKIKGITVITNSIDGLFFLSSYQTKTISSGGVISSENRSVLVGHEAEKTFDGMYADISFISAQGIDEKGTIYDSYLSEIPIRNILLKNSKHRVFLADKSKVGRLSAYKQCTFGDVDTVVSDIELTQTYGDMYKNTEFIQA
ncbi:MAG: DeoR/GlpR family DNA-binding transcription regulator [Monoglobales bacterium]